MRVCVYVCICVSVTGISPGGTAMRQQVTVGEMLPCAGYNNNDGGTASGSTNNNKIIKKITTETQATVAT